LKGTDVKAKLSSGLIQGGNSGPPSLEKLKLKSNGAKSMDIKAIDLTRLQVKTPKAVES
jgi:hypothetical protein